MKDYTIAAIPTLYRGRQYRSRLEARWAAFFDLLGWRHEYEPFDLGAWSPDFLLPEWQVLVEVKPLTILSRDVWEKAVNTCAQRGMFGGGDPITGIFVTNTAPTQPSENGPFHIGWFGCARDGFQPNAGCLAWRLKPHQPIIEPAILCMLDDGWWCSDGWAGGYEEARDMRFFPHHAKELWSRASNAVQWLGRQVQP